VHEQAYCEFVEITEKRHPRWGLCGFECRRCKAIRPRPFVRRCDAACRYIGTDTGGLAAVVCKTCKGKSIKKLPVFKCSLHGICLPHYRCGLENKDALAEWIEHENADSLKVCRGCEEFLAKDESSD